MKKWNVILMSPSHGDQTITIYNVEFVKTQHYILNESSFKSFLKKYDLKKFYSKGFEIISAVSIESDDPNNRIISKYSIDTNGRNYSLNVKDSKNNSVF